MKKLLMALFALTLVFTLSACTDCEECEECKECTTCEECEECEECPEQPQLSFYETMSFEGSGYTPGYDYFLSGTLNENGEITGIRVNMVSVYGTSKRSSDYDMNVAKFEIGGTSGNQTLDLFIGGSSTNIAQVYNTISGNLSADGSENFMDIPFEVYYPGQVIAYSEEIYELLANALDISIDATTTVETVLTAVGLYDTENSLVKNGSKYVELTGAYGGKNYDKQLTALETYIVDNALTLEEAYNLVATNNQGFDERDAVAGATIMFDSKIVQIFAKAAGIEISNEPVVIGNQTSGTDTIISLRVKGMHEITVSVTIDAAGTITSMNIVSHTETDGYGKQVIEDGTLVTAIIAGQADLTAIDGVSGATLTSDALIAAAQAALDEYSK